MVNAVASLERFGPYKHEGHFMYLFSDAIARSQKGQYNDNSILRSSASVIVWSTADIVTMANTRAS